jgi:hypothetical protein
MGPARVEPYIGRLYRATRWLGRDDDLIFHDLCKITLNSSSRKLR